MGSTTEKESVLQTTKESQNRPLWFTYWRGKVFHPFCKRPIGEHYEEVKAEIIVFSVFVKEVPKKWLVRRENDPGQFYRVGLKEETTGNSSNVLTILRLLSMPSKDQWANWIIGVVVICRRVDILKRMTLSEYHRRFRIPRTYCQNFVRVDHLIIPHVQRCRVVNTSLFLG